MNDIFKKWPVYLLSFCLIMTAISSIKASSENQKEAEAFRIAKKAYIYGYPLVLMKITEEIFTNVPFAIEGDRSPINQFSHKLTIPTPEFKGVVSPNVDTLYSSAFLDLSKEPVVFHVPNTKGRYYIAPIMDAWSNVVGEVSKQTAEAKQGADYLISGPNWKGSVPKGLVEKKVPTNTAWIIGRIEWNGPKDTPFVNSLQKKFKITLLSSYGKTYTPPLNTPDPTITKMSPVKKTDNMDATAFFTKLAVAMANNPPSPQDASILKEMKKIGISPGSFNINNLHPAARKGLERAPKAALAEIKQSKPKVYTKVGEWYTDYKGGIYGTDYLRRAYTAATIFGMNKAKGALYATADIDIEGKKLTGKHSYTIHFEKGQLPPVKGFWSITLYNPQQFLVDNPIHRYSLGDRDKLKTNPDGSVDLYVQSSSPGTAKENNWLPSSNEPFNLMLRLYWPTEKILDRTWKFPTIKKIN